MKELKVIAHIRTDFPEKFGIPRQSGLVDGLMGKIVFEPEYRTADALKGIEEYNYLWLVWEFEDVPCDKFNATVRPPRLGGNENRGVFATRSPFRPNPIGLSSVKLEKIEDTAEGKVIWVSGIDMRDNTPIFDIKPYLAYVDCHADAKDGFAGFHKDEKLDVVFDGKLLEKFEEEKRKSIVEILAEDPRPHYQDDPERVYGISFAGRNVKFKVKDKVLTVVLVD